ncbi:hypothetical protein ACTYEO_00550 [Rhodophyticola sp. SM2404]
MDMIYLPVPRKLYNDVTRFSDGKVDLIEFALMLFDDHIQFTEEDDAHGIFGTRFEEFLAAHYPEILSDRAARDFDRNHGEKQKDIKPLVWKEVVVPNGSQVRMQYANAYHFAKVVDGKIEDSTGRYTPSEWASKVASGTSRNAWRDLSFRFPHRPEWSPALMLREAARVKKVHLGGDNA